MKELIGFFKSVIPVDGICILVELHLLGCTHILDAPYLVSRMFLLIVRSLGNLLIACAKSIIFVAKGSKRVVKA